MNRAILIACAVALLLTNLTTILAQATPTDDAAWSHAVNLMPLINTDIDAIDGSWSLRGNTLVSETNQFARIQIPYEPPREYDFRIVFSRVSGKEDVGQYFSQTGRMAMWHMGAINNKLFGFQTVDGRGTGRGNRTTIRSENCLRNGQTYTSVLAVRKNGVQAYLDGKLISKWVTDFNDASLDRYWAMPDSRLMGLITHKSLVVFQKIELLEITGKGRAMPRQEIVVAKPKAGKQQPGVKPRSEVEANRTRLHDLADQSLQKDAKKFVRTQSSIKGLYVVRTDAGLRVGGAQDIIATSERVSSDRETICDFVSDVAKDTQISMEEAGRLLKVRHPVWQAGYKIRFSYSNKYTKQAGGSAGGAFSVLLLSLLDGMQIDPDFAMTGDVTVDGKIREVGAVAEKLRGALLDKCRVVAIPEANEENLNDLAILYSPAMLWSMQILSIATLDDAAAVARTDRAPNLAKAMELFGQVQRSLPTSATVYALRNPAVVQTLRQVLQLAPNHSSAEYMLRVANNQLPATLSLGGSLDEIWAAPGPLLGFLFADYKEPEKSKRYYFDKVPSGAFKAAMDRLNWLQFRLHPKTRELKAAMVDYMVSLDQLHRQSAFSSGTLRLHLAKRDKVLSEAHLLGTDRKTLEEMMH
ncbi:MAG: hypothetical protein HZA88_19860 [Verrucomicrobia bacterium]|nr:hypothetical protein [Verrucomicrobiota bacterium]